MGEKFAKRVGGGEILRLVKNSIPKKEEKEYSTPLSARNGRVSSLLGNQFFPILKLIIQLNYKKNIEKIL